MNHTNDPNVDPRPSKPLVGWPTVTALVLSLSLLAVLLVAGSRRKVTSPVEEVERSAARPPTLPLEFPITVIRGRQIHELGSAAHYDFWFRNPNDHEAQLELETKSCTCSKVEIRILTPEEEARLRRGLPVDAAAGLAAAAGGLLCGLGVVVGGEQSALDFLDRPERWQQPKSKKEKRWHKMDVEFAAIPPRASGLIRLSWQAKKAGAFRLVAKVWARTAELPQAEADEIYLEVPVMVVGPPGDAGRRPT